MPRTSDPLRSLRYTQPPLSIAGSDQLPVTKPDELSQIDTTQSAKSPAVDQLSVSWQAIQIATRAKGSAIDLE